MFPVVLAAALTWFGQVATAADKIWTGASSTTWSTNGNWTGNKPGAGDNAVFNATFTNQPNLTGNTTIGGLWMTGSVAQNVTISASSGTLTLNSNTVNGIPATGILIDNSNSYALTINAPLKLGNSQLWANSSSNVLTIGGSVDLNGNILTIAGGGNTTISGAITNSGSLIKLGSGTLTLSGANTFTGALVVSAGTLSFGTTTITPTNTLSIAAGSSYSSTGTLNLTPAGTAQTLISGAGTLRLQNSSPSVNAPDIYYDPTGGTGAGWPVTISSAVDVGSGNRYINGKSNRNDYERYGGDLIFSGNLTGSANLNFAGTPNTASGGPWQTSYVLAGNNAAFSGGVVLGGGSNLIINSTTALSSANNVTFTPGTGAVAGLYLYGTNVTIGALSGTAAGTMNIRNGSLVADSGSPQNSGIVRSNATLTVQQTTNTVFNGTIGDGPNDHGIGDSGTYYTLALVKTGSGSLTLGGSNSYTGGTSVNGGTLSLSSSGALGSTGTISFGGGALQYTSGNTTDYSSRFSSSASQAYRIDTNGQNVTLASALTSTGGTLSKLGNGTLTLGNSDANANTYTGLTTLSGGELDLKKQAGTNAIAGDGNTGTTDVQIAGGTLKWLASNQIANTATINMSSGAVSLNGFTETIYALTNSGGAFTTGSGHLIGIGATVTWSGGTNTVNDGGLVEDSHIVITGGTNTVQGGATGGILQLDNGGVGFEITGSTLTLNSDNAVAGKLILGGDLTSYASSATSQVLSGLSNTNPGKVDLNGGNRTFTVEDGAAATDLEIGAVVTNGSVTKAGPGTLLLSAANTMSGTVTINGGALTLAASSGSALGSVSSITVNSGGTLQLGASNQINNSATISLGGGTFAKGNFSEGSTNSVGIGALTLSASGSHLDFGTGTVGTLSFASLNPATFTLTIDNWTGNYNQVGSASTDRLIFDSDQSANLSNFYFTGYGPGAVEFNLGGGFWEVVAAVPEPGTWTIGILLFAVIGAHAWRHSGRGVSRCRD